MRKGRRMCAAIAAVIMAGTLAAGCGSSKGEQADSAQGQKEVFKLTVPSNPTQGDWNEFWLTHVMEEKFNVDIQVEMISSEAWSDKLPLMFTTEELPDFFLNSLSESQIAAYGSEGYLLDLSPYISEDATPNIWKAMEEIPTMRTAITESDGAIYCLNGVDMAEFNLAQNRFYINYDWADKILGKQPETLDEFYEYLKGVKEQDMNGNGDPTDEIPLGGTYSATETIHVFPPILEAFGFTKMELEAIDGKVVYVPAEANYQHFLEFVNNLYEEELLDNEFFSQTEDQANAKGTDYRYGAYGDWASWVNQPEETIWRQYDIMEPLISQYNSVRKAPALDINKCGSIIITKNCKNPEKLMEIVDWLFSFDGTMAVLNGFEKGTVEGEAEYGYAYKWADEKTLDVRTYYNENEWASYHSWKLAEMCPDYGTFPIYRNYNTVGNGDAQSYLDDGLVNHLAPYYHVGWPSSIKLTEEELNELTLISTDIQSYKDEMVTKMIIGEVSTDEFESFQEGLKERNLGRMLEIYQAAYNRWAENQ